MLELFTQSSGYTTPDTDKPANLISNEYFPFINLVRLSSGNSYFENSISTYYKPSITKDVRVKTNSSVNILNSLTFSESIYKFVFTSSTYFIGKGIIMDAKGEILLLTTVKRDLFKDFDTRRRELSEDNETHFSYNNFVMFVASELAFKEEHSVFYRRLQKIYLNFCFEKGMEVRFLPSSIIEKNTFANSLNLRFNSIDQLDYHLRNEVKNFLLIPEADSEQRSLHINIPPVNIVMPVTEVDEDLSYLEENMINREHAMLIQRTEAFDRSVAFIRDDLGLPPESPESYLSQDVGRGLNTSLYVDEYGNPAYNYVAGVDTYLPEPPVEITLLPPEEPTTELEDPDIIII